MKRFWAKLIFPILNHTNSKYIIEIGAFKGENTKNLVTFCQLKNGKLTVIDIDPQFDSNQYVQKFNHHYELIQNYSLQELPFLSGYDSVLIDGDHNWFTVYHELTIIDNKLKDDETFPIIFLHDVEWPYARRDMYYNPSSIPDEFLHPNSTGGVAPGCSDLIDLDRMDDVEGAINHGMNHALKEGGERNGVLTAIEDFLQTTSRAISFHRVSSFHGLGILSPSDPDLDSFIQDVIQRSGL
ncbi:class I SAM-dependent methyltransferase [Pontibacillus salicampi]|uniref:Class I SAM-dependent methyltransferase n=1 Tax=Pontibacillus salicampi TaxID=1449801 RepID=A0ABV6LQ61_9BACI